jgi:hypothetical protein
MDKEWNFHIQVMIHKFCNSCNFCVTAVLPSGLLLNFLYDKQSEDR